jgi:predicted nucleotidyltransferase component of viral defense system
MNLIRLQWARKLDQKPFAKLRARDYYDLWKLLNEHKELLDLSNFPSFLKEKCDLKQVSFVDVESFFAEKVVQKAKQNWNLSLKHLVGGLPQFDVVAADLRAHIPALLAPE